MKKIKLFVLMVGVICATSFATELPALFTDNMVLQQNSNAKIWGIAKPEYVIKINGTVSRRQRTTNILHQLKP